MSNSEPEEDFAALFAQHEARHAVERGQVVKGRVIQISDEHVFVDVGGKGEAWIDRAELTDEEGGRNIVLSRRALLEEEAAKTAEQTRKKLVPEAVLPGTVVSLADFGAFIDLGGGQGLVPVSELS